MLDQVAQIQLAFLQEGKSTISTNGKSTISSRNGKPTISLGKLYCLFENGKRYFLSPPENLIWGELVDLFLSAYSLLGVTSIEFQTYR